MLVLAVCVPMLAVLVTAWVRGWTIQAVRTGSMAPGLPVGSAVVLAPVDPADVGPGTVISFEDPDSGRLVTHRVVRVNETDGGLSFVTRGDANLVDDAVAVPARYVRGELRWRVLGLGSVIRELQRPGVQVAAVAVPVALLVLSEVAGWRHRQRSGADRARIRELEAEVARLTAASSIP